MIDLLLLNGYVITMDQSRRIIENGAVAIDSGKIIDVGVSEEISRAYSARKTIDCTDQVIMPGFIDAHGHGGHDAFKSIVKDTSYWMPIMTHIYKQFVSDEFWYYEARMSALHRLHAGVTTGVNVLGSQPRCDDPIFAFNNAKGYSEIGVKPIICTGPCSLPWPHKFGRIKNGKRVSEEISYEQILQNLEEVIDGLHNSNSGKTKAYVAPFGIVTSVDPSKATPADRCIKLTEHDLRQARDMRKIAKKYNTRIHTDAFGGMIKLAVEDKENALLGPDVHLQHCTGISIDEVRILSSTGTNVSFAPNMNQFKETTPILEMLELGVPVALATDGSMLSSSFDMFSAMNRGQSIFRIIAKDDFVLPSEKILEMTTIDAAKCIGLEQEIGSLDIGKRADVITIDLMKPHLMPRFNIMDTLINNASASDIENVIIDGEVLMKNGIVEDIDEKEIMIQLESEVKDTIERMGLEKLAYPQKRNWGKSKIYYDEVRFDLEKSRDEGSYY